MEMSRTTEFTVSGIIRYWGAVRDASGRVVEDVIADELARRVSGRVPVAPGTAVVTGSGALADSHGVRHVIHVASVAGEPGSGFRQVRNIASCVTNALVEADRLARADANVRTILFPLLGVGVGGGPVESTVATMVDSSVDFLTGHPSTPLAEIRLLGFSVAEWQAVTEALRAHPGLTRLGDQ
jgi:O-acetyl-ADP-ribose deacetylase (regulator of RNase III)